MIRVLRFALLVIALVALAASWPSAQGGAAQKPPDAKPAAAAQAAPADTQKPAAPPEELPAEAKAFNAAAGEKVPLKRVEALEKFIADYPKSTLAMNARSLITSTALASFKDSRAKYLSLLETEVADAQKRTDIAPLYSTYNSLASRFASAGIFSEEAEDYARKGLAGMDEKTYMEMRKRQYDRSLAAYDRMIAAAADAKPAAPPAPAPDAASGPRYRVVMKDGVMQASLAPPAPPRAAPSGPPRPPTKPKAPTDDEIRAGLKSERASALATLGQILVKRGKATEGEKVLAEAFAAKPASSTMATIARVLAESAKKAGNDASQFEYLTALALTGRITADETKDFEAVYRKTHNGSLDGLDKMLDERFHRENVRFAVTPFVRTPPAKSTGRTVLAEVFPGAG